MRGFNDFTALNYLDLSDNSIEDISILKNFSGKHLYISDNQIADISALQNASNITHLSINRNKVTNIDALSSMNLFSVAFAKNTVKDLVSLQSQQTIGSLSMQGNYIDTVANTSGGNILNTLSINRADVNALPQKLERLSGNHRITTAISIALNGWGTCDNLILVNSTNFIDSICLAPLAKLLNAPILLTGNLSRGLEYEVQDAINELNPQKIYIIGGANSVNTTIENALKENYTVERIYGSNRFITCTAIADKVKTLSDKQIDEVFLVNSLTPADALAISSVASIMGIPILFNPSNYSTLESTIGNYINSNNINKVTIIGGTASVQESVADALSAKNITVSRIAGKTRYLTALYAYQAYNYIYDNTEIALLSGKDTSFTDILAGVSLVSKNSHPLLFIDYGMSLAYVDNDITVDKTDEFKAAVNGKSRNKVMIFGGTGLLPETIISENLW